MEIEPKKLSEWFDLSKKVMLAFVAIVVFVMTLKNKTEDNENDIKALKIQIRASETQDIAFLKEMNKELKELSYKIGKIEGKISK